MPFNTQWSETFLLCTLSTVFSSMHFILVPSSVAARIISGLEEQQELLASLKAAQRAAREEREANESRRRWVRYLMHEVSRVLTTTTFFPVSSPALSDFLLSFF